MLLALSFLPMACKTPSGIQDNGDLPRVENVEFKQEADTVTVFYDLLAKSTSSTFDVTLLLSLENEKIYEIELASLSGDVGEDVSPGKKKTIKWDVLQDFPNGLEGKNVQFMVNAKEINNRDYTWAYITGSALILGGAGIVIGLLLQNSDSGGLPLPPSRPSGN